MPPEPIDLAVLNSIREAIPVTSIWDRKAKKEALDWAGRQEDKKNKEHKREQAAKNLIHWAILFNIGVAGICIGSALIVRTFHMLAPKCRTWLDTQQIENLDTLAKFAITGALGSLLTRYLNKNTDGGGDVEESPQQ